VPDKDAPMDLFEADSVYGDEYDSEYYDEDYYGE